MTNVTIYTVTDTKAYSIWELGTWLSLQPYSSGSRFCDGHDDGGVEYALPEGYSVIEDQLAGKSIVDAKGDVVDLVDYDGTPALRVPTDQDPDAVIALVRM